MDIFRVPEKLKILRETFNLTQSEMADKLNMKQSQYSLIENGKQVIQLEKIGALYNNLGVSPVWMLMTGDDIPIDRNIITGMTKSKKFDIDNKLEIVDIPKSELIPKEYESHIPVRVVTSKARAGFSDAYYADEYLEDMPTILIEADKEYKGRYLAFEVDGDSMEPEYNRGDVVICREIPRANWQYKLHYEQWDFVIAHGTQGIMLKEITSHDVETGEIICHSLNTEMHPDFPLNLREVAFLYNVVEHRRHGRKYRRR